MHHSLGLAGTVAIGHARCSTDRQDLAVSREALSNLGIAADRSEAYWEARTRFSVAGGWSLPTLRSQQVAGSGASCQWTFRSSPQASNLARM